MYRSYASDSSSHISFPHPLLFLHRLSLMWFKIFKVNFKMKKPQNDAASEINLMILTKFLRYIRMVCSFGWNNDETAFLCIKSHICAYSSIYSWTIRHLLWNVTEIFYIYFILIMNKFFPNSNSRNKIFLKLLQWKS